MLYLLSLASKVEKKKVRWADEPKHQAPTSEGTVSCFHTFENRKMISDNLNIEKKKRKKKNIILQSVR